MTGTYRICTSAVALLLALAAAPLAPSAARAADLGGDCCADLETRVADLEATTVRKGNKKVTLTVSGRVNANLMWFSDNSAGTDSALAFDIKHGVAFGNSAIDITHPVAQGETTRLVFSGDGRINADSSMGFYMSVDNNVAGANTQFSHQTAPVMGSDTTYVYIKNKTWGEYRLGNLPSASDDAYYIDFGAPGAVGGLAGTRFVGTYHLRASSPLGTLTDVTYGHVLGELADLNDNRLMYVSPTWNGFAYKSDIGAETGSAVLTWSGSHGSWRAVAGAKPALPR